MTIIQKHWKILHTPCCTTREQTGETCIYAWFWQADTTTYYCLASIECCNVQIYNICWMNEWTGVRSKRQSRLYYTWKYFTTEPPNNLYLFFAYRWFDKPMSLVVTKGGVLGSNVEHSRWDGTFMSWVSPPLSSFIPISLPNTHISSSHYYWPANFP